VSFPFKLPSRYEYDSERLEGGQGYVYVCIDTFLQRRVAIKVMKLLSDGELLKKEIASLSEIRSRHVAEVYDLVIAKRSGMLGLVQEYVPGPDLSEYVQTSPTEDYLLVLWQLACGLWDIHQHGKIHRDIKPGNIRFDTERVIKILDFGLAADSADAVTVHARGTKYFLAPELYRSPPISITKAVDVYAFGVVAWYLATKGSLAHAMREIPPASTTRMPSFAAVGLTLPAGVVEILDRTLVVAPTARPTMERVKAVLEQYVLYGKHRAYVSYGSQSRTLCAPGETITLTAGVDSLTIAYNGVSFSIVASQGDTYVNNVRTSVGSLLPGSCVITLGHPRMRWDRMFVPIDMSHPGVVI
jgi:serine/threonine-protein kinase